LELAPRTVEQNRAPLKIGPRVGNFFQPFENISNGHAVGPEVLALEIAPIERHRHGGAGAGAHRVWTNHRLRVGVTIDVQEDAPAPLADALLERALGWLLIRYDFRQLPRHGAHRIEPFVAF